MRGQQIMDDADMAQNRVFNNAMEKQVDIRVRNVENAPSEENRTFKAALVYNFPMSCVQALPKKIEPRHNFGLSCFSSSPGSSIYVLWFPFFLLSRNRGNHKEQVLQSRSCCRISEVDTTCSKVRPTPGSGWISQYFSARGPHRVRHDVAKTFAERYVVGAYIYSPTFA